LRYQCRPARGCPGPSFGMASSQRSSSLSWRSQGGGGNRRTPHPAIRPRLCCGSNGLCSNRRGDS
jgi:hypothetical protein